MTFADTIDPIDLAAIAVLALAYGLTFSVFLLVARFRQRKLLEAHRRRLDQVCAKTLDS